MSRLIPAVAAVSAVAGYLARCEVQRRRSRPVRPPYTPPGGWERINAHALRLELAEARTRLLADLKEDFT